MALGAGSGHVLRHFTRRGLALAAAGVALGLPGAWAAGRVLRGQLYGVSLVDPLALGATAALFAVVAVTASVVTARRAARTDPAQSLVVES
jgi:ABC-type antimicrobial peptide transport system permease subunit